MEQVSRLMFPITTSNIQTKNTNNFIEPKETLSALGSFLRNKAKRLLLFEGLSGIGKTSTLKHFVSVIPDIYYVDISCERTAILILESIYSQIYPGRHLTDEVYRTLASKLEKYFPISDIGNINIENSEIKQSSLSTNVIIEIRPANIDLNLFLLESKKKILGELNRFPICIILDQFETAIDNLEVKALIHYFLENTDNIKIILSSQLTIINDIASPDLSENYSPKGLSDDEAIQYLNLRQIIDPDIIGKAVRFCKGFPLFLKMLTDVLETGLSIDIGLKATSSEETFRRLMQWISDSLPEDLKHIFYYLPLCRIFSSDLLRSVFNIDSYSCDQILSKLKNRLYVENIGQSGLYRFHELFCNTRRIEIHIDEALPFDEKVIKFYADLQEKTSLHILIEPFYHLQYVNEDKAFQYFEHLYKPFLDRKQKGLSAILIGQIRLDLVKTERIKNWYFLRIGGFYREFSKYDVAIEYFNIVLNSDATEAQLRAYTFNNLGICYMHTGKFELAMNCFNNSNDICEKNSMLKILGFNYNNIGILWSDKNDREKSKWAYDKAYEYYNTAGVQGLFLGKLFHNYGIYKIEQKEYKQSIKFLLNAETEYLRDQDLVGGLNSRLMAARSNLYLGRYKEALQYIEKYIDSFESILQSYSLIQEIIRFYQLVSIIALYNDLPEKFVIEGIKALEQSLHPSIPDKMHYAIVNNYCDYCIILNNLSLFKIFINGIKLSSILHPISNKLCDFLIKRYELRWILRDPQNVFHSTQCKVIKINHFLETLTVCDPAKLLTKTEMLTCKCLKSQPK